MSEEMAVVQGESASVLDQVDMFRPLPAQLKAQLEARLVEKIVGAGQVIFNEGDPADAMYLVVAGEVTVSIADKALGLSCELARLGPGMPFGEMALLTGGVRSATVRAVDDTTLRVLNREILYKLVQVAPQVALQMAGVLARRLEDQNRDRSIEFGTLKGKPFDPNVADLVPLNLVKRHRILPISRASGIVTLATPDPSNRIGLDDMRNLLRPDKVKVLVVPEADFAAYVQAHLSGPAPVARPAAVVAKQVNYLTVSAIETPEEKALQAAANNQDIAALASAILVEGIDRGASDVHIEPDRKGVLVRYRIDGLMVPRDGSVARSLHAPLVSRLKVLAGLNITERRLPQDGRISLEINAKPYDLRVATVCTRYGEKVTLRILDSASIQQQLTELIAADKVAQVVRKLFHQPNGLVLVTGPTGSGKTTTLYAALRERLVQSLSICTVEDPVEYELPGVTQVQINEQAGLGFPEVVRAFMRQNPDIIFVGEMRDTVTAKMACNAALTGHLVLSSLHTNDALSTLARLKGMGVEPYVLASSVLGIVNQRLVRRICPSCRAEAPTSEATIRSLHNVGVHLDPSTQLFRGKKCKLCNGEGFKGRVGVYELLVITQKIKDIIAADGEIAEIRKAAMDGSYVSLARFSTYLLTQGLTEPSELLRILPREGA
ncbi:MAG: Flp pilus assembly complex ATPase component TadA [Deltaproteobacteria bacterium]|nr:Flp pilus assembly complex ATPase component TadA [Deltaproteobacteria bacterium]